MEIAGRGKGPVLEVADPKFAGDDWRPLLPWLVLLGLALLPRLLFERGWRLPRILPAWAGAPFSWRSPARPGWPRNAAGSRRRASCHPGAGLFSRHSCTRCSWSACSTSLRAVPAGEEGAAAGPLGAATLAAILAAAGSFDHLYLCLALGALGSFLLAKLWAGRAGQDSLFHLALRFPVARRPVGFGQLAGDRPGNAAAKNRKGAAAPHFAADGERAIRALDRAPGIFRPDRCRPHIALAGGRADRYPGFGLRPMATFATRRARRAFAQWRSRRLPGESSSFSFGLPLDVQLSLQIGTVALWPLPPSPSWQEALISGQATLYSGGEIWGNLRYWLQPRPGFRLAGGEFDDLRGDLVRGKTLEGSPMVCRRKSAMRFTKSTAGSFRARGRTRPHCRRLICPIWTGGSGSQPRRGIPGPGCTAETTGSRRCSCR